MTFSKDVYKRQFSAVSAEVPQPVATAYDVDIEIPLAADTKDAKISIPIEGKTQAELQALIDGNNIELSLIRDKARPCLLYTST